MEQENFALLQASYLEGLKPQYRTIAKQLFDEGIPFVEVYQRIAALNHKKKNDRSRPLTAAERKFLGTLAPKLRKEAYASLMDGVDFEIVCAQFGKKQNDLKINELKKETVKQALKTVMMMQKAGIPVPFPYYELIFDWNILKPMDYELFGKMALLMLSTYDEQGRGKNYQEVRTFMFAKIDECFELGITPHPLIFDFMFKGDWISEKTFMILHIHAQELIEAGFGGKLALPLERMLEVRRKGNDALHPFSSREENYFISLINLFQRNH